MGKEIEIKIPLSESQYDSLKERFFKNSQLTVKNDEYYTRYESLEERKKNKEPDVIRIRTEKTEDEEKAFFTVKVKSVDNGIEVNKEDETFVQNPEVLRTFFKLNGYFQWFCKEKQSLKAHFILPSLSRIDFLMELEIVNSLKYLEVEVTQPMGLENAVIEKALEEVIGFIGLDPSKKDERNWYTIISSQNSL
ncbi:MAG: hypothetical protein IKX23_10965 [Treponema sp.]|nr:hypothetical protein [Treponema sp.]